MTYTPIPQGTENWDVPVNAAFTSQDARITELEDTGSISPGVFIPPGWGQFWRAKRNASAFATSRIIAAGDSLTEGYYASNTITDSWAGLMRTSLQNAYGDGGSGLFSTSRTDVVSTATAGAVAAWEANGSFATTTGVWTLGPQYFGPGVSFMTSSAAATATFNVRGSLVKIYNITGSAPRANFTYSIDGGAPVGVTVTPGPTAIQTTTVGSLSPGNHQVVIAWNGAPADVLYLIGVAGENNTGVIVDNAGRAGITSTNWSSSVPFGTAYNGGPSLPADLVICSLGLNDAAQSIADSTWVQNMGTYLNNVKSANNGETDIILVLMHDGNFTNPQIYANYSSRIKDLAENYSAALVNLWAIGRNSWDYWNSFGYWGNATTPGPSGTDNVHLSDAGHAYVSSIITPIVMS